MKFKVRVDDNPNDKTIMRLTPSNYEDRSFLEGLWATLGTGTLLTKLRVVENLHNKKQPWMEQYYIEILRV